MSMKKYITHRENLGPHSDAFPPNEAQRVVYLASDVEALESAAVASALRVKELESLLHRVIEWEPALPAEATLIDEIHSALMVTATLGKGANDGR
jgi:hypothetical protein